MDLAALDRRVAPEAAPDRLGERLRAVDDEQTRHRWIEAALDQVIDQRLHHGAVLGCPFYQPERVLEALAVESGFNPRTSSHGHSGVELTRRSLSARTLKQNDNCNARVC